MYDKLLKGMRSVLYYLSGVMMLVMLIVIFTQVVTRYIFNYTPEWSEELARFLFVWVVFLGSALIMGESGHLAVEFLPTYFKDRPFGKVLRIITNLSGYVLIILLLVQGFKMTKTMTFQISPGLGLPMSYVYSVIPLGSILMLLYLFKETGRIIKSFSSKGVNTGAPQGANPVK